MIITTTAASFESQSGLRVVELAVFYFESSLLRIHSIAKEYLAKGSWVKVSEAMEQPIMSNFIEGLQSPSLLVIECHLPTSKKVNFVDFGLNDFD
jgi:hypothetical protein